MTEWWWVRHGPTHQKSFVGWSDVAADLSDAEQIARLHDFLPQDAIVVSSDLQRTIKTADAIGGARTRLNHDPDLREMHFGEWEQIRFDDIPKEQEALSREFWENPGHVAPPGGESWFETQSRVGKAVARLEAQYPNKHLVAVAHFGVILTQIQMASGMTPAAALRFQIDNFSVTRIRKLGEAYQVLSVNHVP